MKSNILLALGAILLIGTAYLLFIDSAKYNNPSIGIDPHVYGDKSKGIAKIKLYVFYAVPNNKTAGDLSLIQSKSIDVLEEVSSFHKNQFRGESLIEYYIYPEVVFLENDNLAYDTYSTQYGNFEALKSITLELENRAFKPEGDLSQNLLGVDSEGAFRVIAIIYEGVGASGTEGSMILSRDFMTRDEYSLFRPSLFYHEFGHTIGMPEGYDIKTNRPFTNDIMGAGRREPIRTNFIESETLKEMGVISE
ncbi:MAG TPA: hypothetical protein VI432_01335 [Candidatus Paceibacterota bacterium]